MKHAKNFSFFPRTAPQLGKLSALIVFFIGVLAIIGWIFENDFLKKLAPQKFAMQLSTAICFLFSATALLFLQEKNTSRWKRILVGILGAAVSAIGLINLATYVIEFQTGHSWSINPDAFLSMFLGAPTRMAINTAILFSVFGFVFFLLSRRSLRAAHVAHAMVLPLAMITYLSIVGYVLNVPSLYDWFQIGMAFNSALAFSFLCIASICARRDTWLTEVFTSEEAGGEMARRLLPSLILLPIVIGWLRLYGERTGYFQSDIGVSLVAVTYTVCLIFLLWLSAKSVNRTDRARRKVEIALHESEQQVRRKLENILSPEGDIKSFELADVIDAESVQALMNDFYQLTHIPMAIIDLKGNVVVGVGWQEICTEYHRVHPESCKNCLESDLQLSAGMAPGEFRLYKCKNNMWDVATPILMGGKHVGNIFTGQFFFEGEHLDYEQFRLQARRYGFDEEKYLAALDAVPRFSREAVNTGMAFLLKLAHTLSQLSYSNINLARALAERAALTAELEKSRDELETRVLERTAELNKTNEALEIERRRFNDVLDLLPAYVILLAPDYHVPFANRYFKDHFGDSHGKRCFEYLFNREEPCLNCETYKVLETGKPQRWEWTGPDGRVYDISDFPFQDVDGSTLILEMGIDITERREAEEKVRAGSLYARSLLEASLDPLVTISPEGKITDVNETTEQATGISRDRLIGTDFSSYFTEPEKASQGYQKVLSEGLVRDYPLTIRHISGKNIDVLYNATLYRNEAGAVQGVFAAARDITERKAVERRQNVSNALMELFARKNSRREYLGSVAEVIRDWSGCCCVGIRVVNPDGTIPYEAFLGFDPEFIQMESRLSLAGDSCFCVRAIAHNPDENDLSLLTAGRSFCSENIQEFGETLTPLTQPRYRGACIRKGFASLAIVPIRYHGEVLGAIHLADERPAMVTAGQIEFIEIISLLIGEAIQRFNAEAELEKHRRHLEELVQQRTLDLQEANEHLQQEIVVRKQTEEELTRSNLDLEQFAYIASHDLQEPLRAVGGFMGILRKQYQDKLDADAQEYIRFAVEGAERMQALINDLLTFSRVGTKGSAFRRMSIKTAFDAAIGNLRVAIDESNALITSDSSLPNITADASQMTQLLQNLFSNAIKFRGKHRPEIHLSASREDGRWTFAVRDNGIGIEPQYHDRIFLIFQRLHSRNQYSGTGIGLAVCKKIVERHGGTIWIDSRLGEGSTFNFTIPDRGDDV